MVTSVGSSILTALGASSIDTASLVDQLATAAIATKTKTLTDRETANTAKVSDLGTAVSSISTFSSSLSSLISGGSLFTQPTSSNSSVVSVSALAGSRLSGLSSTIKVERIASAQTMTAAAVSSAASQVGLGTMELTVGGQTKTITITSANNSLAGLSQAIKDAGLGVSASIVTDSSGARLVVKGATGAANAFSLKVTSGTPGELDRFAYDPASYDPDAVTGLALQQQAQDAQLVVDGVTVNKATNSFSDVIPGVKINLQSAAPGTTVTIGSSQPVDAIKQAVSDFVAAYNEMKGTLGAMTGANGSLRSDAGIRALVTKLGAITSTHLTYATDGSPTTLAEIGVSTNRDGTLTLDSAKLSSVMASNPSAVEAMFNPGQRSDNPLIQVTNAVGSVKGGVYTVTNATPGGPGTTAQATLNGGYTLPLGTTGVQASFTSAAAGLAFDVLGPVGSATITIDLGLQGALDAIKTELTGSSGQLTASQTRLDNEKESITDEKDKLAARDTAYRAQLTAQYTRMQSALSAFSSTQSYLSQQIKLWTNDSSS
ncbi:MULTISPECIES: flagellar filament capping protein FliD [unclassified Sphingomonas]|uniref:flagellar filament capping protein FliD n=1 Tax=unclassified Sphingomonas TaxID=196159 RepID=UPI0006F3D95D|nr:MULTISPECIES: flagellar filament capping protein FliD [unclassified Sphingomonas]KQX20114.1 flagellar hook protein [Sphingomonas sp. Root1294]KQY67364.1 flagellar hook protein [Sphingomonas sp. Root50]KRB90742.1 flagellar hook protein [Sphingomonas sp. Root720]